MNKPSPTSRYAFTMVFVVMMVVIVCYSTLVLAETSKNADANINQEDGLIEKKIQELYEAIPSLQDVEVQVQAGVVQLTGKTIDRESAQRAEALAAKVEGVITVENAIERDVSLDSRLTPAWQESKNLIDEAIGALPLFLVSIVVFIIVYFIGGFIAKRRSLWSRVTPNAFVADLVTTSIRFVFTLIGLVLALNLVGATALLSAVLGSAGVIGLAVGFAVKDTIENYIASILLSLRQPFRPMDHVVINDSEGRVIRLTSRATVLMTLDGNHLRIPNSQVFKGRILNFTANPERRFDFELGVDANDDPLAAIQTGINAMESLEFVLRDPPTNGIIKHVGDSNIVICFMGWINQRESDFGKARSIALTQVKNALEEAGFGLPEPIYRLRFDQQAAPALPATMHKQRPETEPVRSASTASALDVSPDHEFDAKVQHERRVQSTDDLLDDSAPTEY